MSDAQAYDDGSEVEVEVGQEEGPQSGEWVDHEEFIHNPSEDEVAMGEFLGQNIDIDDDDDNGSDLVLGIEQTL